jgi:hypothetical protein
MTHELVAVVLPSLAWGRCYICGQWMWQWSPGAKKVTSCQLRGVDSPVARGDTALRSAVHVLYTSAYT